MPLVTSNWYGIQAQGTPFDDAERQNAAARNAALMGRDEARGINQDNLNFATWQTQRGERADAARLQAQRELAKMGMDFETGRMEKQHGWDTERTASDRAWELDPSRPQNQMTAMTLADLKDRQNRALAQRQALDKFVQGGGLSKLGLPDDVAGLIGPEGAGTLIANTITRSQNKLDAEAAQLQQIVNDPAASPEDRKLAREKIATNPQMQQRVVAPATKPKFDPTADVESRRTIELELNRAIEQSGIQAGRTAGGDEDVAASRDRLQRFVEGAAERVAMTTGYSKDSVRGYMLAALQRRMGSGELRTAGQTAGRVLRGVSTLGLSEIGNQESELQAATRAVLKTYGLGG
jgi:hypothetical protein